MADINTRIRHAQARARKEIARLEAEGFEVPAYVKQNIEDAPTNPKPKKAEMYLNRANLGIIRGTAVAIYRVKSPDYVVFSAKTGKTTVQKIPDQIFRVPYHERNNAARFVYSRMREDLQEASAEQKRSKIGRDMTVADIFEREADATTLIGASAKRPPSAAEMARAFGFSVQGGKKYGGEITTDIFALLYGSPRQGLTLNKAAQSVMSQDQLERATEAQRTRFERLGVNMTTEEAEAIVVQLFSHPEWKILGEKLKNRNVLLTSDQVERYYTQEVRPDFKWTGKDFLLQIIKWIDMGVLTDERDLKDLVDAEHAKREVKKKAKGGKP